MTLAERILSFLEARFLDSINPPVGELRRPFINAGGEQYANALWDWDSWISNLALRQAVALFDVDDETRSRLEEAERGCILNFLDHSRMTGFVPVEILPYGPAWRINHEPGTPPPTDTELLVQNPHKPCLAQHAAFIAECQGGDAGWLAERFSAIQLFLAYYKSHCRHACGLYFFQNDVKIGVDNDPCTFGRPPRNSGAVYLNSLLHREFLAGEAGAHLYLEDPSNDFDHPDVVEATEDFLMLVSGRDGRRLLRSPGPATELREIGGQGEILSPQEGGFAIECRAGVPRMLHIVRQSGD